LENAYVSSSKEYYRTAIEVTNWKNQGAKTKKERAEAKFLCRLLFSQKKGKSKERIRKLKEKRNRITGATS
jgi:hypothetical protein